MWRFGRVVLSERLSSNLPVTTMSLVEGCQTPKLQNFGGSKRQNQQAPHYSLSKSHQPHRSVARDARGGVAFVADAQPRLGLTRFDYNSHALRPLNLGNHIEKCRVNFISAEPFFDSLSFRLLHSPLMLLHSWVDLSWPPGMSSRRASVKTIPTDSTTERDGE